MIKNERQYRITRAQAEQFERAAQAVAADTAVGSTPAALRNAELGGLRSQAQSLREELAEYDALRSGHIRAFASDTLDELPAVLIRARIARGLTQRELAERLGLKEQQIQRYEATEYASASLTRLRAVVEALGLVMREEFTLAGD